MARTKIARAEEEPAPEAAAQAAPDPDASPAHAEPRLSALIVEVLAELPPGESHGAVAAIAQALADLKSRAASVAPQLVQHGLIAERIQEL